MGLLYLLVCIIAVIVIIILVAYYLIPTVRTNDLGATDYENLVEQTYLPSLDCIEHDREQCIQL